jgi:hypothetical protein
LGAANGDAATGLFLPTQPFAVSGHDATVERTSSMIFGIAYANVLCYSQQKTPRE